MEEEADKKIEALLFSAGTYLDEMSIAEALEMNIKDVQKILKNLEKVYDDRGSAIEIKKENDKWKMNVRKKYLHIARKMVESTELNEPVLKTLAVIAYKNPIMQTEIIKIRNNKAYEHIHELEELGFIQKERKGRSYSVKLTPKFYDYFDTDEKNVTSVFEAIKEPEETEPEVIEIKNEDLNNDFENIHNEFEKVKKTNEDKENEEKFLEEIDSDMEKIKEEGDKVDIKRTYIEGVDDQRKEAGEDEPREETSAEESGEEMSDDKPEEESSETENEESRENPEETDEDKKEE
ncbi:SMC-Scp complex subunit ScpB [Candidatus Woesearchaeota archaeon]|nr:SMC-Scp complex subunit ScpB [Candidatus Woesearchaeota archaeon]